MSRNSGYRLSVMIFGLALCLAFPACRTCTEKGCKTVLLGSSSTPDGKWVHVGFLTVK
jgi:hypothetical protein